MSQSKSLDQVKHQVKHHPTSFHPVDPTRVSRTSQASTQVFASWKINRGFRPQEWRVDCRLDFAEVDPPRI